MGYCKTPIGIQVQEVEPAGQLRGRNVLDAGLSPVINSSKTTRDTATATTERE